MRQRQIRQREAARRFLHDVGRQAERAADEERERLRAVEHLFFDVLGERLGRPGVAGTLPDGTAGHESDLKVGARVTVTYDAHGRTLVAKSLKIG